MARKKRGAGKAGKKWVMPVAGGALLLGIGLLVVAILPRFTTSPDVIMPIAASPAEQAALNAGKPPAPPPQPQGDDALAPLFLKAAKAKVGTPAAMSSRAEPPEAPQSPPAPPPPPAIMPAPVREAPKPHPVESASKRGTEHAPPVQIAALPPPLPGGSGAQPWKTNAVAPPPIGGRPMIAIVLDDMGVDDKRSRLAVEVLKAPLTASLMTYAGDLPALSALARAHGDEVMLHVPMQPLNAKIDPGPNALTVTLSDDEIRRRLDWGLARVNGIVGINNHMGSRFTEDAAGMRVVLEVLRQRGLFYLDSRTTPHAVGYNMAKQMGMPHVARDVFLDDVMTVPAVEKQLALTEKVARHNGFAVAIGHPHDSTIAALKQWLPTLAGKGFAQVPITAIVRRNEQGDHALVQVAAPVSADSP